MQKLYKRIRDGPSTIMCWMVRLREPNVTPQETRFAHMRWNSCGLRSHDGISVDESWLPGNRVQDQWFESSWRLQAVISGDSVIE
jgi:hypothetical protein